jgi:hypothetical protein
VGASLSSDRAGSSLTPATDLLGKRQLQVSIMPATGTPDETPPDAKELRTRHGRMRLSGGVMWSLAIASGRPLDNLTSLLEHVNDIYGQHAFAEGRT